MRSIILTYFNLRSCYVCTKSIIYFWKNTLLLWLTTFALFLYRIHLRFVITLYFLSNIKIIILFQLFVIIHYSMINSISDWRITSFFLQQSLHPDKFLKFRNYRCSWIRYTASVYIIIVRCKYSLVNIISFSSLEIFLYLLRLYKISLLKYIIFHFLPIFPFI